MKERSYAVTLEKTFYQSGVIEIFAESADEAQEKADQLIREGLQTRDERIHWDDPVYIDFSFSTTGDIEEVE